jgi:hypothetical protein
MFDRNAPVELTIRKDGKRRLLTFRFPNDEEWGDWYRARKTYMHNLGQGESTVDVESKEADKALYAKLTTPEQNDGFDASTIGFIIDQLARTDVTNAVMDGDQAIVTMKVAGNYEVEHVLRIPDTSDVWVFNRSANVSMLPFGRQRIRNALEPGVKLYDTCLVSPTGYAPSSGVPALHKDAAIRAVLQLIGNEADSGNE